MTEGNYAAKVTAIIDNLTGGFEYPDSFDNDVAVCFLRRLSPENAAEELLADYTADE